MEINNRRYLGNKYKLLSFIKDVVEQNCSGIDSVMDIFAGTGVVASVFTDKRLILNDILYSNHLAHITWFSPESKDDDKLSSIISTYNNLKNLNVDNYMTQNYSDTYFSRQVCSKIGYIRDDIEELAKKGIINSREKAILITSLLYAVDKIACTVGHYDAYRKNGILATDFVMTLPQYYDGLSSHNECYQMDANDLARRKYADLVYMDPPYNSRQYSDAYHLLENIAVWEKPQVYGVARKMNREKIKSDYCTNKAPQAFQDLVESLNCKYILLSYNNTGEKANDRSNAKLSDEDIMRVLQKKGTVYTFEQDYKAFTTGKSCNNSNKERLFLCKVNQRESLILNHESVDEKLKDRLVPSPLNYTGGKYRLLPQLLPLFPSDIDTFVDLFCGGCNVGINVSAKKYIYNDIEKNVIGLMRYFYRCDVSKFMDRIEIYIKNYGLSDSTKHPYSFYGCDSSSGLAEYNKTGFLQLRSDFNNLTCKNSKYYELFYLLIVYSFNNQIRFNSEGCYNLPVGKRDFNEKMRTKLIEFVAALKKQQAVFCSKRFQNISPDLLDKGAFVYADPPYLITTATYNEQSGWTSKDEIQLLNYLDELNNNNIRFALSNVITHKGKENAILKEWIAKNDYYVHHLSFNYSNANYHTQRTADSDEVLITNYEV